MLDMIRKQFLIQKDDLIASAVIAAGAGLFGIFLLQVIYYLKPDAAAEYVPLGTILSGGFATFFAIAFIMVQLSVYFRLAVRRICYVFCNSVYYGSAFCVFSPGDIHGRCAEIFFLGVSCSEPDTEFCDLWNCAPGSQGGSGFEQKPLSEYGDCSGCLALSFEMGSSGNCVYGDWKYVSWSSGNALWKICQWDFLGAVDGHVYGLSTDHGCDRGFAGFCIWPDWKYSY